jgi:GxxExxY protein
LPDSIEEIGNRIIGCGIEVHRVLGPGLLETIYKEALVFELRRAGLSVDQQMPLPVLYKGTILKGQRIDLVVEKCIVVEVKATSADIEAFASQCLSYLRIGDMPLGYVMNFHAKVLKSGLKRLLNERWTGFAAPPETPSLRAL